MSSIQPASVSVSGPSSSFSPSTGTQTPASLSSSTPRKLKLRKKVRSLRKKRTVLYQEKHEWTIEDFNEICDKFLSKPLAEIIKAQAILKHKTPVARRYSMEYKKFALTLYFLGPRAYSFMSKLLCLPSKRTLQNLTRKLVCKPGLANDSIFNAIQIKVKTMLEQDKHCTLCIDEMALQSNLYYNTGRDELVGLHDLGNGNKEFSYAKNALVIMARGLYSNWKQPVAYFFLKSQFPAATLRDALEECVAKLTRAGLHVEALVSDMGSNFIELSHSLGVSPENSEFCLSGVKIIYLYDVCHLIKATRNNLIKNIFHFNGKKTSWSFIEQFFKLDSKHFYRCAPKLTNSHIYPSNFEKMKVKLAVQVLSHTVASGLNVYMSLGALPGDEIGTIEVVDKFNKLFDLLNSSATEEKNQFKKVFEGDEGQLKYLDEIIQFFKGLKVFNQTGVDITSKCKFQKCWLVTINGIRKLWENLSNVGFKYLKTKRVNSDSLENFFGAIRQQGGNCINPTSVQFQRAFRKLFCQNYLHSSNMNCKDDLDELLIRLDPNQKISVEKEADDENVVQAISLPDYSYRQEDMVFQNPFKYVCGYLLRKALNVHHCQTCVNFSKECEDLDTSQLLTYFKAYDNKKSMYGGLRTPSEQFINFIYNLEKQFVSHFDDICITTGISHSFLKIFKTIPLNHPCSDFPLLYILKLFIRLRIFYTIKYANRDLKNKKQDKKNRKILILSHL